MRTHTVACLKRLDERHSVMHAKHWNPFSTGALLGSSEHSLRDPSQLGRWNPFLLPNNSPLPGHLPARPDDSRPPSVEALNMPLVWTYLDYIANIGLYTQGHLCLKDLDKRHSVMLRKYWNPFSTGTPPRFRWSWPSLPQSVGEGNICT